MPPREESGTPVLVSIDGLGPLFGRLFVDPLDDERLFEDPVEGRFAPLLAWRVSIPEAPEQLVERLRPLLVSVGPPVEVRVWGAIEAPHYVGRAYGELVRPWSARSTGITLFGQGAIERRIVP